ncbi:MAG: hypothetical protein ACRDAP_07340 [Shewanella sp.]
MVVSRRQFAHARRWLPLWGVLLVWLSFGNQAASEQCHFASHCNPTQLSLEKAMPCASFSALLAATLISQSFTLFAPSNVQTEPFLPLSLFIPEPPYERLERPPR